MTFAKRMSRIKASAIREILKVTERPDVLSFAGGLPAPEAFPIDAIARAHEGVLRDDGAAALQYGTTEGFLPLRAWIAERMATRGLRVLPEQVLVTAGSQQGIDLVAKAFLDAGDTVIVESPCYLAALQAFEAYEARFEVVPSDDDGMCVDQLESVLRRTKAKLLYLVPTFQNPRGTTLSLERRHKLVRLAAEYGVPVLEDDPYGELRYSGTALPLLASLEPRATVVHLGSFSKTLAPGLRLGFAIGPVEVIRALTVAKQAADLHSGMLAQRAVARLFETFDYEAHLSTIRALYGLRLAAMLAAIERHFPAGTEWTRPQGGLFVWARLPEGLDAQELFADAMHEKVAFVPGAPFYPSDPQLGTMRLNFSNRPPALIAEGMARLGACATARLRPVPAPFAEAPARSAALL